MAKPEEGHGSAKVENRLDKYNSMLKFLDIHTNTSRQKAVYWRGL